MRRLTAYVLDRYYGEPAGDRCGRAAADAGGRADRRNWRQAIWRRDSSTACSIRTTSTSTGESFDYGPWRFAPTWEPGFTAAYFDHAGLYAFGRQPEAIHWDAMQLAVALRTMSEAPPLIAALDRFPELYREALGHAFCRRLGVETVQSSERLALGRSGLRVRFAKPGRGSTGSFTTGSAATATDMTRASTGFERRWHR